MRAVLLGLMAVVIACGSPRREFADGVGGTAGASTSSDGGRDPRVPDTGGTQNESGATDGGDASGSDVTPGVGGQSGGQGGAGDTGEIVACTEAQYDDGTSCQDLTVCAVAEFEQSPPSADKDRVCVALSQCGSDEYEKTPPSANTNRECGPLSVCGAGTFVSASPADDANRECSPCPASTFSSALNVTMCAPWSACKKGESQSVAPSTTSDRVCSSCGTGKYESNGQCLALTVCKATEYEAKPATATSNRTCSALTVCQAGGQQTAVPTATTDRQCAPCSAGTYSTQTNASSCAAWTTCGAEQYESAAPSATLNRGCTALSSCSAGTRVKTPATATSNRVCQACSSGTFTASSNLSACQSWTDCAAGFAATAGSATKDRTCKACASGSFSTIANAASCQAWQVCGANQTQTKAGSSTSDVVCTDKPSCGTAVDRVCTVDCPCAAGQGVCTASTQCASGATCASGSGKKFGRSGNTCVISHCDNDKKDADETSVDCGGACGCRATYEVVSYKNIPSDASFGSLNSMSGDGSRFAAILDRSRMGYPAAVAADGTVTELQAYGQYGYGLMISGDGNVISGEMGCANPPSCTDTTWSQTKWVSSAAPVHIATSGTVRWLSSSGTYAAGQFFDAAADVMRGMLINGNQLTVINELKLTSGISKDGKYVGGELAAGGVGLWYSQTGGITKLSSTAWDSASIVAVNGTAPVVIGEGYISASSLRVGFRWKGGTFTPLGVLPGTTYSGPTAVSNDGGTVVGTTGDALQAFIWTDADKLRTIVDELTRRGYEPASDLLLKYPKFISEDGKTIVGVEIVSPPTFWRVVLN